MESMKKFISLLLVFSITVQPVSYAQTDPDETDETVNPFTQNPPGTPPGVQCTSIDQTPSSNGVCCVGLQLNGAGKCDEVPYSDPALVSCNPTAPSCSGGTGCFPQRSTDLYSGLSSSTESEEVKSDNVAAIFAQMSDDPKPSGSCVHPRDCESYNCVAGNCQEKMVCRFAGENEVAPAGVDCGKGLAKNVSGKCELTPEAKNPVYLGLLNDANIEAKGQCRFELAEETKRKSIIAMRSLRAMEWFFSTLNVKTDDDCFRVTPLLKDQIGIPFRETRKNILSNFTEVLNGIETDYKKLLTAKEESKKMLSIHNGESIVEGDLATRQTSGYDTLMILYRRNNLMQSLEQAMLETVKGANTSLTGLSQNIGSWSGGSTSWKIGDENISAFNCNGSKYKKRVILTWKTKYYKKIQDRWANYYEVTADAAGNADIVKKDLVKKHLALIGGVSDEQAVTDFATGKYYLMDPMMFAGMNQGSYGTAKKLKKKSGFAIFGGFKDLRHAWYIKGDGTGSYTKMYNDIRPSLESYYRSMKTNSSQKGFIYEPELLTTEAKDCLDNPENAAGCKDFQSFLDEVQDEAFANYLAWSHSKKDDYSSYFSDATTYRRKLLAKMEVDMQNIQKYYEEVIQHRDRQNACLEKVMNGLIKNDILVDGSGGIQEGGVPIKATPGFAVNVKGNTNTLATSQKPGALVGSKINPITRSRFQFDLRGNANSKLSSGSILDSAGIGNAGDISNSAKGGVGNTSSALLAIRKSELKKANDKASGAGINVAAKEKTIKGIVDSLATRGAGASGISGSGGSSTAANASNSAISGIGGPSVSGSEDAMNGDDANKDADKNKTGANGIPFGSAGNSSGYGSGSSEGAGADGAGGVGANANANAKDGSGLTDAEREKLLAEAERNRGELSDTEGDELFKKVSKAYVRNLDKVLNKKKKID